MTGSRLTLARMYRGMTRKELAQQVGVTPRAITGFEKEETQPSKATLSRIAEALLFNIDFFDLPPIDMPSPSMISFRSRRKIPRSMRDSAVAYSSLCVEQAYLENMNLNDAIEPDLPDLHAMEPVGAALLLRSLWALGETPVNDLPNTLMLHGVRQFGVPEKLESVGTYSFWDKRSAAPCIFERPNLTEVVLRQNLSHELGHLCLHQGMNFCEDARELEQEADMFAAEFLMPKDGFAQSFATGRTASDIAMIQAKWGVPLTSVLKRAQQLGILHRQQCRRLFDELNSRELKQEAGSQ